MADGIITQVKVSNNKIYDISLPGLTVTPSTINQTVTDVQSFFADNALNRETLDTLKEIQTWMDTEGAAADALAEEVAKKADKATTLSGYGITDAYTKTASDAKFAILNKGNNFNGEQRMLNSTHAPTMNDIASGVGCSLKNSRACDNQLIVAEIWAPTTAVTDNTINMSSVVGQIGFYHGGNGHGGQFASKTLLGKINSNGWEGNVKGNVTGNLTGTASNATTASKVAQAITIKLNGGTTEGTNMFTYNGSTAKAINIAPSTIGAAPTGHASTATTYGIGTASNYGHVKLSDATNSTSAASAGIAASPAAVKSAYDLAGTKVAKAGDTMTGNFLIEKSNPYVGFKDTGYSTMWYMQAYQDQFGFGPSWTNAVKSDKNGNMTVPGTVKVGNAVTLQYNSSNACLDFIF